MLVEDRLGEVALETAFSGLKVRLGVWGEVVFQRDVVIGWGHAVEVPTVLGLGVVTGCFFLGGGVGGGG
jgi:hypothetical protein